MVDRNYIYGLRVTRLCLGFLGGLRTDNQRTTPSRSGHAQMEIQIMHTLDGLLVENLEIMTKQYITLESANACLARQVLQLVTCDRYLPSV